ncbi:hypothetical protein AB0F92_15970 [Kitasatospora aureofaciens]|uniref:hypothetical protein n=1 Tax=Kitasatospora aureofaciens TaxID=1894 RepID=UPI00092BF5FE|nr:hypothetical protein CP971_18970 [Streptomyces viridifaciens]UKZ07396.1 hypothetical protein BOQ63_025850 [Streptomyces viridifaciens]
MADASSVPRDVQRRIDEARAMMTEEIFEGMLAKAGTDPADLAALLDVLAIGITNGAWRNSCVENWHAEGRLSDGDMMRINSHTTHGVRQRLRGWTKEFGITTSTSEGLAGLTVDDADALGYRLFRWLTNPGRKLPTGATLAELARTEEELDEYVEHADQSLRGFVGQMEDKGVRFGLLYTAGHGALACQQWWGHPTWSARVDRFVTVLDNPEDDHWGPDAKRRERLLPEPSGLQDRSALRATLLKVPWELDGATAEWITDAGIGYLVLSTDAPHTS